MIENKRILSVITARAGSKGIPGKKYKRLVGQPLFMWSVLASLQSKYVDKTVISSNCPEIERIYLRMVREHDMFPDIDFSGLGFIKRPEEISGDLSKNEDALIHALEISCMIDEVGYDVVINLQPTSPCRFNNLLDRCIEAYQSGGYDSLLTATKDTPFLWQRIGGEWKYTVDRNDHCDRKMRQEFEEDEFVYHDNGNIYLMESDILLDTKCRIGYNPCIFETVGLENKQIDEETDFEVIETMLKVRGVSPVGDL